MYKNRVYAFHYTTDTDDLSASVRSGTADEMPDHEHSFDMGMFVFRAVASIHVYILSTTIFLDES